METLYTVNAEALRADAARVEAQAADSLPAWILLGQSARYAEEMRKARALRNAADASSVSIRREILRNAGFIVKTARHAGR